MLTKQRAFPGRCGAVPQFNEDLVLLSVFCLNSFFWGVQLHRLAPRQQSTGTSRLTAWELLVVGTWSHPEAPPEPPLCVFLWVRATKMHKTGHRAAQHLAFVHSQRLR